MAPSPEGPPLLLLLLPPPLMCRHAPLLATPLQAIRDSFSLDIGLVAVQNRERRRYMYNLDVSLLALHCAVRAVPSSHFCCCCCCFWWQGLHCLPCLQGLPPRIWPSCFF